ncbi:MAG TPA: serine hydrolase domain-containing protein, partial [Tepidiformaceae bacterium]|nr:serine hydrolase domain-containing protein [Tepidiformaceae bacterium]
WEADTLVHLYSVTKPFAAACLLLLVDRGQVALDEPVATYWPEFARAGKERVTLRQLLSHQAGLLGLREPHPPEAIFDWERMTSLLAAEAPWWEPGREVGEHAYFYGHLVGEVVRRVTGVMPGEFFRREIGGPWGLDFHFGLTSDEQARTATVRGMDDEWRAGLGASPGSLYDQAMGNPPGVLDGEVINSRAWREAQIPAVNGHGTARAVARFYAGFAAGGVLDGVRLFSEEIVREATSVQAAGEDQLLARHVHWGLGFQLDDDGFGMGGLGGALGWGNAEHQFGFGYVTARMWNHDRALAVFDPAARAAGFTPVE